MTDAFPGIQPIVLVGGRSRRFGRDKLRQPMEDGTWLVDRPIAVLRAVFGPRVAVVGECDAAVAARADLVIADTHPGVGPIGGVLSALEATKCEVFVLAGDLPLITVDAVRTVLCAAESLPSALAVLATTDGIRVEPCIGVYRTDAMTHLHRRLLAGQPSLFDAVPANLASKVRVDGLAASNVNRPEDLPDRSSRVASAHDTPIL
jgi:molybdopterin-guanine dinucleotide biosynthesis protein A